MCHSCSYHILTSSVIYYWTDTWQHGIYLLYIIKEQSTTAFFLFQNLSHLLESRPLPTLASQKKAIWRNLLSIQNEAISLVAMHNKQLWSVVKKNHATVRLDSNGFSWNQNLQQKQNWTAKSTTVKENAGKINSVFVIRAALWAEKLECFLEYCWSWKNTLGKHTVAVNTGGHLIRVLNERRVTDGGSLCPLWLVILKFSLTWYQRHLMAAIQLAASCGELYFSRCCALKRTGTFGSESKVTCLF